MARRPSREGGYHPICSLMAFADVGDVVTTFDAEALTLRVSGPFARELAGEGDNLILRAARALIATAKRPVAPIGLHLDKRSSARRRSMTRARRQGLARR